MLDRSPERSLHPLETFLVRPSLAPSLLSPSLPPSRRCLDSVRPQLPAGCWGTVRISGVPGVWCSQRAEAGTAGRPAVGGSGWRPLRLPRATFKLEPASRRHLGSPARLARREPAGRPPLGECPQVCPLSLCPCSIGGGVAALCGDSRLALSGMRTWLRAASDALGGGWSAGRS